NIHRHRALGGGTLRQIIPRAVDEVGGPTILATLTVVAALMPMAFVSGLMGPYMSPIPINASTGMLISLVIAFVVTPWLALHLTHAQNVAHVHHGADNRLGALVRKAVSPFMADDTGARRRVQLYIAMVLLIGVAMAMPAFELVILNMLSVHNN